MVNGRPYDFGWGVVGFEGELAFWAVMPIGPDGPFVWWVLVMFGNGCGGGREMVGRIRGDVGLEGLPLVLPLPLEEGEGRWGGVRGAGAMLMLMLDPVWVWIWLIDAVGGM